MPRKGILASWEDIRNTREVHWAMECFAEMLGVCIYVYFGIGATAGWVIGNINKETGTSSVLQIGFGYTFGVFFALIICATTSGGHLSPAVTIAFCIFKKFPALKAMRYIIAQTIGAFIACLLVYNQWKVYIDDAETLLRAAGAYAATQFTPNGPAGIFVPYLSPGQTLHRAFMNEFVNCTIVAMIIWAALDPTNYFAPPVLTPFLISFGFGVIIWGFDAPGLSLNTARDIGARLMAVTIWGLPAIGGRYAVIGALTNIPATLLGVSIYEFFLVDSDRAISGGHMDFINHNISHGRNDDDSPDMDKKGRDKYIERSQA
jgi:glycerol uptake facilitator-like aquaporin